MSTFRQNDRSMAVAFDKLNFNDLLLERFSGVEKLSKPFQFDLAMLAPQRAEIPFGDILGNSVTVHLTGPGGSQRYFNGIVDQFVEEDLVAGADGNSTFVRYRARMVPRICDLKLRTRCRIFQEVTVLAILQAVFKDYDVNFAGVVETYPARNYCVQYQESDLAFACRLMAEEGYYYFFEHTKTSHRMVVLSGRPKGPAVEISYDPLGKGSRLESIPQLRKKQKRTPGSFTTWDYHFQEPSNNPAATVAAGAPVKVGDISHSFALGGNSTLGDYQPANCAKNFDLINPNGSSNSEGLTDFVSKVSQRAALAMERSLARAMILEGKSGCPLFSPGTLVKVHNHFRGQIEMVLTEVRHEASIEGAYTTGSNEGMVYRNGFQAIPSQLQYRPPLGPDKPRIPGNQTAVVVTEEGTDLTTDPYGRVKVQFAWDPLGNNQSNRADGNASLALRYWDNRPSDAPRSQSCWIRVGQDWAGNNMGTLFTPRKDMEVIVSFTDGDPDRPMIVGCVYNQNNMPPFALPSGESISGWKTQTIGGNSNQFNGLAYIDAPGQEVLQIQSERNLIIRTEGDLIFDVGGNIIHNNCGNVRHNRGGCISEGVISQMTSGMGGGDPCFTTAMEASSGSGGSSVGDLVSSLLSTWINPNTLMSRITSDLFNHFTNNVIISTAITTDAYVGAETKLILGPSVDFTVDPAKLQAELKKDFTFLKGDLQKAFDFFVNQITRPGGGAITKKFTYGDTEIFTVGDYSSIATRKTTIFELGGLEELEKVETDPTAKAELAKLVTVKKGVDTWTVIYSTLVALELHWMGLSSDMLNETTGPVAEGFGVVNDLLSQLIMWELNHLQTKCEALLKNAYSSYNEYAFATAWSTVSGKVTSLTEEKIKAANLAIEAKLAEVVAATAAEAQKAVEAVGVANVAAQDTLDLINLKQLAAVGQTVLYNGESHNFKAKTRTSVAVGPDVDGAQASLEILPKAIDLSLVADEDSDDNYKNGVFVSNGIAGNTASIYAKSPADAITRMPTVPGAGSILIKGNVDPAASAIVISFCKDGVPENNVTIRMDSEGMVLRGGNAKNFITLGPDGITLAGPKINILGDKVNIVSEKQTLVASAGELKQAATKITSIYETLKTSGLSFSHTHTCQTIQTVLAEFE